MDFRIFTEERFLLNLLLRLALMAGYVSVMLGFRATHRALFTRELIRGDRVRLACLFGLVFGLGMVLRVFFAQEGFDLTLEGILLAGFLGGTRVGTGAALLAGVPAVIGGEYGTALYLIAAGALGGLSVRILRAGDEIWKFSLNPVTNVVVFFETLTRERRLDARAAAFFLCILLALGRALLVPLIGLEHVYGFHFENRLLLTLDVGVSVSCLGIAVWILKEARLEYLYQKEERELIRARLSTLRSQVNPHFLFNTLNSISTLIRIDPEKAREMVQKLSNVFRQSLDLEADYISLAEEMEFIDNYLAIERVRFGEKKLRIEKSIDEAVMSDLVPALILQPLLENSIKHVVSKNASGATIHVRARREGDRLRLEVEDSGIGLETDVGEELFENGVGLSNVRERVRVGYGRDGLFEVTSSSGGGLKVVIELPPAPPQERGRN